MLRREVLVLLREERDHAAQRALLSLGIMRETSARRASQSPNSC